MKNTTAQSVIEYAILIGIVASALMAMQVYIKRGVQAGIKVSTDTLLGEQSVLDNDYKKPRTERVLLSEMRNSQDTGNIVTISPDSYQTNIEDTFTVKSSLRTEVENIADEQ